MPDAKLSALVELAVAPAITDELYIRDISEPAIDESKRITVGTLFTSPTINGTVATTGLTLPAFTLSGVITGGGQTITGLSNISFINASGLYGATAGDAGYVAIRGGLFAAGSGAFVQIYGKSAAPGAGRWQLSTPNVAGNADILRLRITGNLATSLAEWTNVTHTGIVLSGALDAAGQFVKWTTSLDSAAVANEVSISGFEIGAGARALAISQEDPVIVEAIGASDRTLRVRINGTTYKILLHT